METFKASDLQIQKREQLKPKPGKDHQYTFGGISTDYMLDIDFDASKGGWQKPVIRPNEEFELDPMNATLHFSIECFEGLKAYKTDDDRVLIYRPDRNFMRMNSSHKQLALPQFDPHEMTKCLVELIRLDQDWIPKRDLHSLYIRPTGISMDNTFEIGQSQKAKVFVVLSPVGKYYPRGFVPVKLLCDTKYIRAWPQGFGDKKVGGNYAPTIKSGREAEAAQCDQVLWLLHDQVTEVGTMNFFLFWKNEQGEDELITPELDGTILPGVTRDSILTLMKEKGAFKVTERKFTIHEVCKASREERVYEAFGAGTAAVVCPIKELVFQGQNYRIPIEEDKGAGPLTQEVLRKMTDLQYGRVSRPEWQVFV